MTELSFGADLLDMGRHPSKQQIEPVISSSLTVCFCDSLT